MRQKAKTRNIHAGNINEIKEQYESGLPVSEIAAIFKIDPHTVRDNAKRHGWLREEVEPKVTEENLPAIQKHFEEGYFLKDIAAKFGLSEGYINWLSDKHNWDRSLRQTSQLSTEEIGEIQKMFLDGKSTDFIAEEFGVSGQYIRKLAKDRNWKELREKHIQDVDKQVAAAHAKEKAKSVVNGSASTGEAAKSEPEDNTSRRKEAKQLALLAAQTSADFRTDTPATRQKIVLALAKGISPSAACRSVGISHAMLKKWRSEEEFGAICDAAQFEFVARIEDLACDVSTPREALSLLERHPLTRQEWGKQETNRTTIKIEYSYAREDTNVVDADFKEVPQIEAG